MRDEGFIVVRNPLLRHPLWLDYGAYFLDLVRYAVFKDTTVSYKGTRLELKKGQCVVPYRFLAQRWNVWPSTAERWVKNFEKEGLILRDVIKIPGTRDRSSCGTRVTIVNYSDYQLLAGRAREVRDARRDANRYIEEGSCSKNEMKEVPPFASEREPQTNPAETDGPDWEVPVEAENLLSDLSAVLGGDVVSSPFSVDLAAELAVLVGWPEVRSRTLRIAEQLAGTVEGPVSFAVLLEGVIEELGPEGGIAPSRRSCDETPESRGGPVGTACTGVENEPDEDERALADAAASPGSSDGRTASAGTCELPDAELTAAT